MSVSFKFLSTSSTKLLMFFSSLKTGERITNLFSSEWLKKSDVYGFDKELDGLKIKELFNEYIQQYCSLFMSAYLDDDCKPIRKN